MGKLLDRMTRAMGKRLPITVIEGNRRPDKPVQAAKLASEGGITIRGSVPILTHWKEYKKRDSTVLDDFMGALSVSIFILALYLFFVAMLHVITLLIITAINNAFYFLNIEVEFSVLLVF